MGRKLELHIKPKTSVDQNMEGSPIHVVAVIVLQN